MGTLYIVCTAFCFVPTHPPTHLQKPCDAWISWQTKLIEKGGEWKKTNEPNRDSGLLKWVKSFPRFQNPEPNKYGEDDIFSTLPYTCYLSVCLGFLSQKAQSHEDLYNMAA